MNKENTISVNQAEHTNNGTANGNIPAVKPYYPKDVSLKELIAKPKMQEAIREYVFVPDELTVKEVRKPFENGETNTTIQKVKALGGTTLEDAVNFDLTLHGIKLDPVEALNKRYRILDYTFALEANMSGGKFGGYSAKGLKLMVTKLEEVK